MQRYYDCPQILRDYLTYHETIKGQSQLTINEYYLDLRMFLRFMKLMRNDMPIGTKLEDIDINDAVEFYQINLYFENGARSTEWSDEQFTAYYEKQKNLFSLTMRFFNGLNEDNIEKEYGNERDRN